MRLSSHCVLCERRIEKEREMRIIVAKAPHSMFGGITQLSCGKEKPILCVCVCGLCVQLAVVNLFSIKLYFIRFSMASISAFSHRVDIPVILIALTPN